MRPLSTAAVVICRFEVHLSVLSAWQVPSPFGRFQKTGTLFRSPHNEDHKLLGSIMGPHSWGVGGRWHPMAAATGLGERDLLKARSLRQGSVCLVLWAINKGTKLGTPKLGNPKNIAGIEEEHEDPGGYMPTIFLLYYWGSLLWGSHVSRFDQYIPGQCRINSQLVRLRWRLSGHSVDPANKT